MFAVAQERMNAHELEREDGTGSVRARCVPSRVVYCVFIALMWPDLVFCAEGLR